MGAGPSCPAHGLLHLLRYRLSPLMLPLRALTRALLALLLALPLAASGPISASTTHRIQWAARRCSMVGANEKG